MCVRYFIMGDTYNQEAIKIFSSLIDKWDKYKNDYIEMFGEDEYFHFYQFSNEEDHTTFFDYNLEIISDTESCPENVDDVNYNTYDYDWEYEY